MLVEVGLEVAHYCIFILVLYLRFVESDYFSIAERFHYIILPMLPKRQ